MAGCIEMAGHALVDSVEDADLLIYNTCAVKGPTEDRMINIISHAPAEKKDSGRRMPSSRKS